MKTIFSFLFLLMLAGCQSIAEKVEIPANAQASTAAFQYPVVAKPNESVVYIVNKKRVPHKWDGNLIFQTEFEITGASATAATVPGEYAILTIEPGSYEVWASRICHAEKGTSTPSDGTVMKVREPGWKTYRHFYGRKFSESDKFFDFKAGKTYVFSLDVNCAMVVQAGGVMFYPRILEADEAGGKYLLMNSKPANR